MPAAIRFPVDLPPPDPDEYGDSEEEHRSKFQAEIGASKTRRKYVSVVRLFDVAWTLNQTQFTLLDKWYQFSIQGGNRDFDIQLVDGDEETLSWFTVKWINEFDSSFNGQEWRVKAQLRSVNEPFETRPSGTDQLGGIASMTFDAEGRIKISKALYGASEITLDNVGRLTNGRMYGVADATFTGLGKFGPFGTLYGDSTIAFESIGEISAPVNYYPELSRQWQNYDWFGTAYSSDISGNSTAIEREFMEL